MRTGPSEDADQADRDHDVRGRVARLLVAMTCAVAVGCLGNGGRTKNQDAGSPPSARVRLQIAVASPRLTIGNAARLQVALVNEGPRDVLINHRMAVGPATGVYSGFELYFRIVGPDRKVRIYNCMTQFAHPSPHDYALLKPGDSFEHEKDLSRCHDLSQPGTYEVVATWRDRRVARLKPPPPAPQAFEDELVSNPVRFEYVPR